MKFLIVFLFFLDLFSLEYKNLIVISPKMNINKIIYIIENVKNNTVLRFRSGYYDFGYNKIMLNDKEYVAIEGVEGTTFKNFSLQITNGDNIRINHLRVEDGNIRFLSVNNLLLKNFVFEETNLDIDNSNVMLFRVISQRDNTRKIFIRNSTVDIGYSTILDNNSIVIEAVSSNIGLFQNYLGMIKVMASNMRILENKFFYNSELHIYFITALQSMADIIGNKFVNNYGGILLIGSQAHIERNFFKNIEYFVDVEGGSIVSLLKNNIDYNSHIVIHNSNVTKTSSLLMKNLYQLRSLFDKARYEIDYDVLKR